MQTIPRDDASRVPEKHAACPSTRISPALGAIAPDNSFIKVDLPAPFSPRMAWIVPAAAVKSTSFSA
ncbi:MAG: hypothetical protein QM711_12850 [Micropruina sp.]